MYGRSVERIWDVDYIRTLGKMLSVFGAWPLDPKVRTPYEPKADAGADADEVDDGPSPWALQAPRPTPEKIHGGSWRRFVRVLVLLQGLAVMASGIAFLSVRLGDLTPLVLGHAMLTSLLNVVHSSRCLMAFSERYYQLIEEYLSTINLFNHKHRSDYCQQVCLRVERYCRALTLATILITVIGIPAYNARPLIANFASGAYSGSNAEFQYSVYYQIPGVNLTHFTDSLIPHIVIAAYNVPVCWWAVGSVWLPDLLSMQVVLHIGGHIEVLRHEMSSFREEMTLKLKGRLQYNDEESAFVNGRLGYFVNYHRKILRFVNMTNSTFGEVYLIYFTYFRIVLCIMMWECSQGTLGLLQYGTLLSASVMSLSWLCVVFENIGTESGLLGEEVYGLPWEYMRAPQRRIVMFMLLRAQDTLRLKVLGINDIGVATMAAILKTSVSYFMLLRTFD